MTANGWQRWIGSVSLALFACSPPDGPGALNVKLPGLRVETSDPPVGARLIGPIQGSDGPDCAVLEPRGTEQGALAALQSAATKRGVDFVRVTAISRPYSDHICVHKRYLIEGIGYAVAAQPPEPGPPCIPACAAGYECRAGACEARCDPGCAPSQYCRFDRVCGPLSSVPVAPVAPVAP